jgi:hypothetical protein
VPLFENTLASVLQNRPADCDVLVVHPESYDDPWEVMDEVQLLETPVGVPLLEMLDASLPYVRGDFLHILYPGLEVTDGWADRALAAFRADDVVAVSPWILEHSNANRLAARGVAFDARGGRTLVGAGLSVDQATVAYHSQANGGEAGKRGSSYADATAANPDAAANANTPARESAAVERVLGPTLRAGFFRTGLLAEIGGWETSLGLAWADVDLALSFAAAGFRCVESPESVILGPSEAAFLESPVTDAASFAERFAAGRVGERVYLRHSSRIDGLVPMVARGAGLVASWLAGGAARPSLAQVAGRLAAWSERPRHREFRRELAEWTAARRPRPITEAKRFETPPSVAETDAKVAAKTTAKSLVQATGGAAVQATGGAAVQAAVSAAVDAAIEAAIEAAAEAAVETAAESDRGAQPGAVPRRAA